MKKLSILFLATVILGASAFAQDSQLDSRKPCGGGSQVAKSQRASVVCDFNEYGTLKFLIDLRTKKATAECISSHECFLRGQGPVDVSSITVLGDVTPTAQVRFEREAKTTYSTNGLILFGPNGFDSHYSLIMTKEGYAVFVPMIEGTVSQSTPPVRCQLELL